MSNFAKFRLSNLRVALFGKVAKMQTVEMGRKLSFDFKLTARTAPELYEAFNHLVLRAAADGVKFNKRKIGVEAAINAVLIDFFQQPEELQLEILRANVPRFEEIMSREEPLALKGGRFPDASEAAAQGHEKGSGAGTRVVEDSTEKSKKRRG